MTTEELISHCRSKMNQFDPEICEDKASKDEYEFYHQTIMLLRDLEFFQKRAIELAEEIIDLMKN